MKKTFILLIGLIIYSNTLFGTHNRAGEITYRQLSKYTYEFTVSTFTYAYSPIETQQDKSEVTGEWGFGRQELYINWGDNTSARDKLTSYAFRQTREVIAENQTYIKSTYKATHTFPGNGVYDIVMEDPNRNFGVINIPNSVITVFSVKTTILINPNLKLNNTPVLLNYPIDKAARGQKFTHNPAAYDPDGDSLSYTMGVCTREDGIPIEGYTLPKASDSIYVNPITGDLVWDTPIDTGIFNIAINVEEWRDGIKIGIVVRDMQIEVYNTNNNPPAIQPIKNICIEAGEKVSLQVAATDIDNDMIKLTISGEPFNLKDSSLKFIPVSNVPGFAASVFQWQTSCAHIRNQPYYIVVKAEDLNQRIKLVDFDNFFIKVIGPAPTLTQVIPNVNSIRLKWNTSACANATGYEIYRSQGHSNYMTDSCTVGIPDGIGFTKIVTLTNKLDSVFTDNNNNLGLNRGINYCYRIVATFPGNTKSLSSNEMCAALLPGIPVLTSASVTKIDSFAGKVFVSWVKPQIINTVTPGPYEYRIYRSNSFDNKSFGTNAFLILPSIDLNDTSFTDTLLNTVSFPFNYKVELYSLADATPLLLGDAETASTTVPDFEPNDNQLTIKFLKNVPWFNNKYVVYRYNPASLVFDSIGFTLNEEYTDTNLVNGVTYTYKAMCYGVRTGNSLTYNTFNWTHRNSGTPLDKTPPCPPLLNLFANCDSSENLLVWTNPNNSCTDDVLKYNIYFTKTPGKDYTLIETIENVNDTVYTHQPEESLSGCYIVTAIDSFGNESPQTNVRCFEGCSGYELPNVFSPNDDNVNDIYIAKNPNHYVKKVDMKIYNRWGKLVYKTADPYINWDGRDIDSKKQVPDGVYYYICDVYEPKLSGLTLINLMGFIHIYHIIKTKSFEE